MLKHSFRLLVAVPLLTQVHVLAEAPAQVKITVVSTEYCRSGGTLVSRPTVEVRLTNLGVDRLVVSRLADITRLMVKPVSDRSTRGTTGQTRQVQPVPMLGRSLWDRKQINGDFFHVIPSGGEVLVGRRKLLVLVSDLAWRSDKRLLADGSYTLRIELDPWRESSSLGRRLRSTWKDQGALQLSSILSEPATLEIRVSQENLSECKGPPLILRKDAR